ncbi:MAG: molybdopterin-binding protein, partial [Planctomycetota bacterium]
NGPQLEALIRRMGAEPRPHRHVPDDAAATRSAVAAALEEADLVITIGGISAGERDHFPDAFAHSGAEFAVRGAAIQPGKPVIVASVSHAGRPRIILGLPGNPVSSLVCACLFGWPIVRRMLGLEPALAWRTEVLRTNVKPNPRRFAYRPARWQAGEGVTIPAWAGSGDLAHTAPTDGIVALPRQSEPVEAGTALPFLPWPGSRA